MKKITVFAVSAMMIVGCSTETELENTIISYEEMIILKESIDNQLLSVDTEAIYNITSDYNDHEDFINNATLQEKAIFDNLVVDINPQILQKINQIRLNGKKDQFMKEYFGMYKTPIIENGKSKIGRVGENNCWEECFLQSHYVWFDSYMEHGNDAAATTAMNYWYAGCSTGCRIATFE